MMNLKYSIGIDVSKENFNTCICSIDEQQRTTIKSTGKFANSPHGFADFIKWVIKHQKESIPSYFLMEATGIYGEQLAWFLYSKQYNISVILPNKAKKYIQCIGLKSKTDSIDAKGLAQMGAEQSIALWKPISPKLYELRGLTRLHEDLQRQKTIITNQLHAIEYSMYPMKEVKKSLSKVKLTLEKEIISIENTIKNLIESDSILKAKYEKITSIKGVSLMTFAVVVAETNGFELFKNSAQLVSYAGYDVVENQSGNKAGKTRISKKGNSHIRRVLHLPAFNVVRHEPHFKKVFDRIYDRTHIKMKAYTAIQKKLLCMIYTLWKKDEAFTYGILNSGNQEAKLLFSVDSERIGKENSLNEEAALDEQLPFKQSAEVLFSVKQRY